MTKVEIRKIMRQKRKAVAPIYRAKVSHEICCKLLSRTDVRKAIRQGDPIAVYLATPDEIDLNELIVQVLMQAGRLVAPRWNGSLYELAPLTSTEDLAMGPHDILEPPPSEISEELIPHVSVWIVPGLAFTRKGERIGYGGGWYDRLLAKANESSSKVGVAYDFQMFPNLPMETQDMPLTEVVWSKSQEGI